MSGPASADFLDALVALAGAGVECVLVGVGGINFYARDPSQSVETQDLDVFLAPRWENLRTALAALHAIGFTFEAGGEPFVDLEDELVLARIIEHRAAIAASHTSGARVDLMLSGAALAWEDLASDAVPFRIGDAEIRVGRLEKLLRAKQAAGRPKDLEFLRMFAAHLREEAGES